MKKWSYFLLLVNLSLISRAQKYDNYWVGGRYPDFQNQGWFGNSDMEFMQDSLKQEAHWRNSAYNATMFSLSDRNGNFLSHSNGFWVMDTANAIIENGDSLNYGTGWEDFYPTAQSSIGYALVQGMHFIPATNHDSTFYIFHELMSFNGTYFPVDSICLSVLVNQSGFLKLTKKNAMLNGMNNLPQDGNLASCRHGNGRDWWVTYVGRNSNCTHLFLLTPDTLEYYGQHCEGDTIYERTGRYAVFSPDGTKYARSGSGGINVLDFDRCNGTFSNLMQIPPALTYDSSAQVSLDLIMSIVFSPNNRYLYSCHTVKVLQYDLWDANPDLTRDTVAELDYFVDTVPNAGSGIFLFCFSQIAPDGKIYIGSFNGERFLCRINNPDGKGDSCQFGMREIVLPKFWRGSMPYYPNYRLGRLPGSTCDTIYSDVKPLYTQTPWLKVYPNPATDLVRFEYNW
ncbi:MAG: hypothetical protein V4615_05515, partial [Bacteroidota bacterium]